MNEKISTKVANVKNYKTLYSKSDTRSYSFDEVSNSQKAIEEHRNRLSKIYAEDFNFVSNSGNLLTINFDHNNLPLNITFIADKGKTVKKYHFEDVVDFLHLDIEQLNQVLDAGFLEISRPTVVGSQQLIKVDLGVSSLFIDGETGRLQKN